MDARVVRLRALRRWGAALLALIGLAAPAPTLADDHGADSTVIVISLDGVRHDYPDRGELPGLTRVAREGARAEWLVPVFPSSTFPNHVSLATGVSVEKHGIVANRFLDRERGEFDYSNDASWIRSEPIWITAERQGVRSAVFFWVGSETDWRGRGASYRHAPFSSAIGEAEKVDQILSWLDLPALKRPRLVMSWWHGADSAGHREGPDAGEVRKQLEGNDAQLVRLLAGLDERQAWPHTTLILVSDHGMTRVEKMIDPGSVLAKADIEARVVSAGSLAHVFLDDPEQKADAILALAATEGITAMAGDAVPEHLAYRTPGRTGDVVVLTTPPRVLGSRWSARGVNFRVSGMLGGSRGAHGYDPAEVPDMQGILIAMGRGVSPGTKLGRPSALALAPTIAALLGIEPPPDAEAKPIFRARR